MLNVPVFEDIIKGIHEGNVKQDNLTKGGYHFVVRNYIQSKDRGLDKLNIDQNPWDTEYHDILKTLREFRFKEITYTATSSGTLFFLHFLIENGCEVVGAIKLKAGGNFGEEDKALVIRIN